MIYLIEIGAIVSKNDDIVIVLPLQLVLSAHWIKMATKIFLLYCALRVEMGTQQFVWKTRQGELWGGVAKPDFCFQALTCNLFCQFLVFLKIYSFLIIFLFVNNDDQN